MQYVLRCPYCFRESLRGITACLGCGAAVHYGAPKKAYVIAIVAAMVIALGVATIYGWIEATIAVVALSVGFLTLVDRKFKSRVVFKRVFDSQ